MSMEIISVDELKNIFYSGYSGAISWDCIDELYIAIHQQALIYTKHQVSTVDYYHKLTDAVNTIDGLGPQGRGHMAIKTIAQEWLRKEHRVSSTTEIYFAGLHPDVISTDHRYVIECGTTDAGCIQMYLVQANVLWVGNIPYPFAEEQFLNVHMFRRGPKFDTWQEDKVNRLREVFRKHR